MKPFVPALVAVLLAACSSHSSPGEQASHPITSSPATVLGATVAQSTELFGIRLKGATKGALFAALSARGLRPALRADGKYVVDAKQLLDGADRLELTFFQERFAGAFYYFPSFMDAGQVTRIAELVIAKYGAPDVSNGDPVVGRVLRLWKRQDGITMMVMRDWPNTSTALWYIDQEVADKVSAQEEVERDQARQEALGRQSGAF